MKKKYHSIRYEREYYNLKDQDFGHWKVLEKVDKPDYLVGNPRSLYWLCECVCGETSIIRASTLRAGKSKSCGCHGKKYHRTEGGKSE